MNDAPVWQCTLALTWKSRRCRWVVWSIMPVRMKLVCVTTVTAHGGKNTWWWVAMSGDEFMEKLSLHVADKGFRMVRYYGFLSPAKRRLLEDVVYAITETVRKTARQITWRGMYQWLLKVDPLKCVRCGWEPQRGSYVHFEGNGAKKPHSYPVSISVIRFNSHFRSYGAQGVLKKHPFCGVFLIFWEF